VFGGVGMKPQERAFRDGTDVIVATPGRLLDHLQYPYADLSKLEVLVLDEADRMLDMGFLPDIRRVLRQLPQNRQTMMFSATMPAPILELSRSLLRQPVRVGVERPSTPASGITQTVYPVAEDLKTGLLIHLLKQDSIGSVIVFTRTKHRANRLAEKLTKAGVSAERIHGNRSQTARTEALSGFKSGKYRVLVATDIAARGIDVEALGHVVNFDVPNVPEDYVHRVGRTARAGLTGEALTFFSPAEETDLRAIERTVGRKIDRVTLADFDYRAKPAEQFEVPLKDRIAEIRARKSEDRARAAAKADRRAQGQGASGQGTQAQSGQGQSSGARSQGQGRAQGHSDGSPRTGRTSSGTSHSSGHGSGGGRVGPQKAGSGARRGGGRGRGAGPRER